MHIKEEKFLAEVARKAGFDFSLLRKQAFGNPLENSMFASMIHGALKALEVVSLATLDFKLVAIVKLTQSWIKDREDEIAQKKQKEQGYNGYQDSYSDDSFSYNVNIGNGYY